MAEDILNSDYWRNRLLSARQPHHAIFKCPSERWGRIAAKHVEILKKYVSRDTSILDVGCGWGRIIGLMPLEWQGSYFGVDVCIDFIRMAKEYFPGKLFNCIDIEAVNLQYHTFDLAICTSFRPMVKRNLGDQVWERYRVRTSILAKRILYLEYDENDEGNLE